MLLDMVGDTQSGEALRSECPYPSLVGPFTHAVTAVTSSFPVWQSARHAALLGRKSVGKASIWTIILRRTTSNPGT